MLKPLKDEHIAGLLALYDACDGTIHAHVRKKFWKNKFQEPYRDLADKIIKKLCSNPDGLVLKHKGRNNTYSITMNAIRRLGELGIKLVCRD